MSGPDDVQYVIGKFITQRQDAAIIAIGHGFMEKWQIKMWKNFSLIFDRSWSPKITESVRRGGKSVDDDEYSSLKPVSYWCIWDKRQDI